MSRLIIAEHLFHLRERYRKWLIDSPGYVILPAFLKPVKETRCYGDTRDHT
jgi:hypothetical protein